MRFVSYLRVSTMRQGETGLGIEAQRQRVRDHVAHTGGDLITEFVEVESGSKSDRTEFWKAVEMVRKEKATLLVGKLDRLSRSLKFVVDLEHAGVPFVACDNPHANRLTVHILAAVAEDERERIGQRTREALAAAKARGVKLGNPRWDETLQGAREAHQAQAHRRRQNVQPIIREIRASGVSSLRGIAQALNARGVPAPRGGRWHPTSVQRVE